MKNLLTAALTLAGVGLIALAYVSAGGALSFPYLSTTSDAAEVSGTGGDSEGLVPDCCTGAPCCDECPPCEACPLGSGSSSLSASPTGAKASAKSGGCCANKCAGAADEVADR